jgi:hypothetical protein
MQWIYKQPKLARMIGQALFAVGGLFIICGLIGRFAMIAINGLSEAYPMYSLWWVPEHFIGYPVGAILAAAGIYVALTAKKVLRTTRRKS